MSSSDDVLDAVLVDVDEHGVAVVTLNRPDRLNAMRGRDLAALSQAYARLDADDDVRVVILTGAGRAFCSGADLSRAGGAFAAPKGERPAYRSSPDRPMAFQIRKPVVAALNGHAIGLGMTLALHCDFRFIAEQARWGVVQVRRGVVPDAVSHWTLVRAVGLAHAAEVLLGGRLFPGSEAVRLGVASRCLPAEEVLPEALAFARELAEQASPLSLAFCKRILWAAADGDLANVDALESEAHQVLLGMPDALEGGSAAHEKRTPAWTSRVVRDWPTSGLLGVATPEG